MSASPPFDLETQYRGLLDVLEGPVSDRWAVLHVDKFLIRLGASTPRAESYLLSLAEPLAERAAQLDPVGVHPAQLAGLADRLREAQEARPVLQECEAAVRAERRLRRRAGLLYGYAGAVRQAIECVSPSGSSGVAVRKVEGSPQERLRAALERAEKAHLKSELEWMRDHWDRSGDKDISVPVVERLPSWVHLTHEDDLRVGGLRRLVVQLHGPAQSEDRVRSVEAGHQAEESVPTEGPVTAARKFLDEQFPRLRGRFMEGRVGFDQTGIRHEGQSAGLAIASLFYGAVLDHTSHRVRARVRPEVLLTGKVAPDGTVNPVEETSLPTKVETAFFSPKTRLVVPEAQRGVVRSTRDELLEDFPHGQLDITGVEHLKEVFYDRRLTDRGRIGWSKYAAQRLWRRRGQVLMAALVLGLLGVIGALLYGPFDRNPASARFRGSILFVENESGRTIEKLEVGRGLVQKIEKGKAKNPVAFADVVEGEPQEMFWGASQGERSRVDVLRAKAVGADTLLWEQPLRFEVDFPNKPEVSSSSFGIADLTAEDLNRDGDPELYALANHRPYFPSLLLQLRPTDGTVRQRYVHPGHLRSGIKTVDLVGGPAPELLTGGHSNAFKDPVLTILRPTDMAGHAPTRKAYAVREATPATHVAYLRFPSTALQKQRPVRYPMIWKIRPAPVAKMLEVIAHDGRRPDEGSDWPKVITTLDYDLQPQSVGTDGTYDRLADSLVQDGVLEAVPGPEDLRRYGEEIWYWTGRGWSSKPTLSY